MRRTDLNLSLLFVLGLLIHPSISRVISETNSGSSSSSSKENDQPPNIIIMLMDDWGWGDMSINGNPASETPNIDRMAREGMQLKDFYSASPLCSPTRAALLTGRLPPRTGFYNDVADAANSVIFQFIDGGISANEELLPELLKNKGYRSKVIGKWHLGHQEQHLPLEHGFDEFYGSPSNYVTPYSFGNVTQPKITVYANDTMIGRFYEEFPIGTVDGITDVSDMTQIYIEEAEVFIRKEADRNNPFFLYWTPDATHTPVYASKEFRGKSPRGLYGDAVLELDSGVGRILDLLEELDIEDNTWVFFSSDNGAATYAKQIGGDPGPFLCGKMTTYEGGMRVPTIAWAPGRIAPGQISHQIGTVMDFFSTALALADVPEPDVTIDGNNLLPYFLSPEDNANPDAAVYYWRGNTLMAIRQGWYKAHFNTLVLTLPFQYPPGFGPICPGQNVTDLLTDELVRRVDSPLLFHLGSDEGEKWPLNTDLEENKKIVDDLTELYHKHLDFTPTPAQFNICDVAVMAWAPKGCDAEGLQTPCLTPPPSDPVPCYFGF